MITLEDAREQLLSQIELELCRIYEGGSEAPKKLQEFYDHVAALPLSNFIFNWYRINADKVQISYIGEEVCIYLADNENNLPSGYIVGIDGPDALDELMDQAFDSKN